jgi:hypothetical protein
MRQRPDVQRHHQDWGTLLRRHGGDELLGGGPQHGEGPFSRVPHFRGCRGRDARFEHRGIVGWLAICEPKIGFAESVESCEGIWTAAVPGAFKRNRELIEAAPRHIDQQFVAVAKMPVGRRRTHSRPASSFREGEAGRSLLRDQFQRRADQGLFQIAMVIAAGASAMPGPAHVKSVYMTRGEPSTFSWTRAGQARVFVTADSLKADCDAVPQNRLMGSLQVIEESPRLATSLWAAVLSTSFSDIGVVGSDAINGEVSDPRVSGIRPIFVAALAAAMLPACT